MASTFSSSDWEAYAAVYDALLELRPYRRMLCDVEHALKSAPYPLLDAGCGTGNLTKQLFQKWNDRIMGMDASHAMLRHAAAKCDAIFLQADLNRQLPFEPGAFGSVVCVNTLYAVEDPLRTLREFRRILRHCGRLVIVTPKIGYENGLILKEHCQSEKEDSYWINLHANAERESALVHEAVDTSHFAHQLIDVARLNRAIAQVSSFRFFSRKELIEVVEQSGFIGVQTTYTYAEQNHLLIATRA